MLSEKFEIFFLILELPYNIGICTNIAQSYNSGIESVGRRQTKCRWPTYIGPLFETIP